MQRTMLFKKFLMPCGLCAAVPTMKPANPVEEHATPCSNETQEKKLIKPSELPIYSVEDGYSKQMPCVGYPSIIEDNIRKVRQSVGEIKHSLDKITNDVSNTLENLKFVVDYLQDEANHLPRIGAVGIGGLSGLILGLRGGMLKRLFYTTAGAGIVGCVCFPREAKQALNTVEHYGNISLNFIYGVKPGDSRKEISLSNIASLKDLFDIKLFDELSQTFNRITSNAIEKVEESQPTKVPETEKK
ncbi:MICOS complex subunit MIC27 [Anthophora quadrimaculata]